MPVSVTLKHLCLCDQNITKMENLSFPNLTELYLYRNKIRVIENLQFCPRVRKLWLFQVIHEPKHVIIFDHHFYVSLPFFESVAARENVKKYFINRKSYFLLHLICQNEISKISGISCLPELTECRLQENGISELNGFEFNLSIQDLGE